MKKPIKILALTVFAAGALFTACSSPEKKVENAKEGVEDAKEDLSDAKQDLVKAKQDSIEDYNKAKAEWTERLTKNDDRIAEYRKDMATTNNGRQPKP